MNTVLRSEVYANLAQRLGSDLLRQRLEKQANHWARFNHQGEGLFKIERLLPLDSLMKTFLKLGGLTKLGRKGFLGLRVVEKDWVIAGFPKALDGFRLLQLTDLHLDLDQELLPIICELIKITPHDGAVITGDFRNTTRENSMGCMVGMKKIISALTGPRAGVLGNHDFIEIVPELEAAGLPILLNETMAIGEVGARFWLCGVDDPHFYKTHDFAKARGMMPLGEATILLCHTPEAAEEAAGYGYNLMLAGHTHGGQMCLPGGRVLVCPVRRSMPQERVKGAWRCGGMQGYTSVGTGSCGVAARFYCPPEITVHRLRSC
ncbi:MAG: metallophosphoesterase [Blastochloris sp.]|nr:metallophosphoesterase [Blastochloris sp.]